MSNKHLTDQKFSQFKLEQSLQQGLLDAGFEFCTPIQVACLPAALEGRDVAGQAQTGTGKTVAFLLACCHYLLTNPPPPGRTPTQPRALILAPTRELAIQIHHDAEVLSRHTGFSLGLVYGGTGYDTQKDMLAAGVDILIGTPGRLIDFFKQGLYDLSHAQVAVMDEADRMFDLGFIRDIRFLLRRMPPALERLNLLFSATLSFKVMELAYEHMNDPAQIKIETGTVVVDQVTEYSFYPAQEEKLPLLVNLLKHDNHERILVFVNTRYGVERVATVLSANGVRNGALSGDVPQPKRERLLEAFKSGDTRVLVATDVAARGLHIPDVSHVYNFDLPQDADDYIHRIGRTARAGASGEAISFVCDRYAYSIMEIESHIGHALPRRDILPELLAPIIRTEMPRPRDRRETRGGNGRRGATGGRPAAGSSVASGRGGGAAVTVAAAVVPVAASVEVAAVVPVAAVVEAVSVAPVAAIAEGNSVVGDVGGPEAGDARPAPLISPTAPPPASETRPTPPTPPKPPAPPSASEPQQIVVKREIPDQPPAPAPTNQPPPPATNDSTTAKPADAESIPPHPAVATTRFSRRYGEIPAIG